MYFIVVFPGTIVLRISFVVIVLTIEIVFVVQALSLAAALEKDPLPRLLKIPMMPNPT